MSVCVVGKRVVLRPPSEEDIPTLWKWRNDLGNLHLWSPRRHPVTREEFLQEWWSDIASTWHEVLIIERRRSSEAVGFLFNYDTQFTDGHTTVTIFTDRLFRSGPYAAEAFTLFVQHLFSSFSFRKIYLNTYDYNEAAKRILDRAREVKLEGVFPQHRYWDGRWYVLYRYAVYRDDFLEMIREGRRHERKGVNPHTAQSRLS